MLKASLVFDTAGVMYISAVYVVLLLFPLHFKEKLWYYRLTKIILVVLASAGVLINLVDTVYYPYTGCRSTLQVLSEFSGESGGQMWAIIFKSLADNWYMVLAFIVIVSAHKDAGHSSVSQDLYVLYSTHLLFGAEWCMYCCRNTRWIGP